MPNPPPPLPPEQLFRSLLPARPWAPIRLLGSEVRVVSITGATELALYDRAGQAPEEIRTYRLQCETIALTVHDGAGGRVFESAYEVGELAEDEITQLAEDVRGALDTICPTYARSDWQAWKRALEAGARHPSNAHIAWAIAQSCDPMPMSQYQHPRPDRFWGLPFAELLDGHWLLFRASRARYG